MRDGVKRTAVDRGRAFVAAYLANGFNVTEAAISAGYSAKGAAQIGCDLMRRKDVVDLLASERQRLAAENKVTIDRVVQELAKMGFGSQRDQIKVKSLELLGKTLGMFVERTENKNLFVGDDGKPILPTVGVVFVDQQTGAKQNEQADGRERPPD